MRDGMRLYAFCAGVAAVVLVLAAAYSLLGSTRSAPASIKSAVNSVKSKTSTGSDSVEGRVRVVAPDVVKGKVRVTR